MTFLIISLSYIPERIWNDIELEKISIILHGQRIRANVEVFFEISQMKDIFRTKIQYKYFDCLELYLQLQSPATITTQSAKIIKDEIKKEKDISIYSSLNCLFS